MRGLHEEPRCFPEQPRQQLDDEQQLHDQQPQQQQQPPINSCDSCFILFNYLFSHFHILSALRTNSGIYLSIYRQTRPEPLCIRQQDRTYIYSLAYFPPPPLSSVLLLRTDSALLYTTTYEYYTDTYLYGPQGDLGTCPSYPYSCTYPDRRVRCPSMLTIIWMFTYYVYTTNSSRPLDIIYI